MHILCDFKEYLPLIPGGVSMPWLYFLYIVFSTSLSSRNLQAKLFGS